MNNIASLLILVFLTITFLQSSYEKLFYWKDTVEWLKEHFSQTIIKKQVTLALFILLVLELITTILCAVGIVEMITRSGRIYGFYGSISACISLLLMLVGQRLAKDYDGARTVVIYFIPAVMAVYWLN